jgi:hypothetical protein
MSEKEGNICKENAMDQAKEKYHYVAIFTHLLYIASLEESSQSCDSNCAQD